MKKLNITIERANNTVYGNPVYKIVSWDNWEIMNELITNKTFKEFNNKKEGRGVKTAPNANYVYALLNKEGVSIKGVNIKAELI